MDVLEAKPKPLHGVGLVTAGLVAGVVLASLATADASAPLPRPAPVQAAELARPAHPGPRPEGPDKRDRRRMGKPIHGEMTVRKPGGGYEVLAAQRGVVTAITSASVTVRSEDDYVRTYIRDERTKVADGVAEGSAVRVLAVVENGVARALSVRPLPDRKGKGPGRS